TLSGSTAISSPTNIGVLFWGSGHVTVSGAISIGSAGLTKDGTGTLTLSNANTYSGATAVNAGVLNIQNGSALGTSSQTTIADGASLQLQGGIAVGSLVLRLNGAGVSSLGALRNISGNNSWSGTITALSASRIHSDAGVLTLSGANAISATNMGVTFGGSGDVVVSGTITTGTGTLTKEGSGTLTLSGANTYTGATTITSGTVVLGNSQVIANTSNVVMNGGTLNTNSFTETVGQLLLQNNSTLALGSGVHTLTFSSAGTFSFKRLTITGWQGNYGGAGSPGTAGRIFIGSGAVVSREQLDQIQFTDGTATYYAIQLSDGELVPGANTSTVPTGNSNVQVTTLATAGGSWSGGTSGPYVFTPNADNANILYTDIEYRLLGYNGFTRGNVRIVTTNGTGTEGLTTNGKSTIISNSDFINSNGTLVTNQRQLLNKFGGFSVASPGTQVGNVNIATLITAANQQSTAYTFTVDAAGDINVSGAINLESSSSGGTTNRASMSVVLTAAGNISITSPITTNASNNNGASGIGPAGSISLTATGNVYTSSAGTLNAIGGYSSWSGTYSRGGDVSISGASVSLGGSISNGGRGGYNAIGVTTGDITISTTNTATTVGLNDGQVSGVITGGNFTKSGSGTFILKSVNTYIGTTTVSGGTLQLGASNALPTSTALTVSGGAVFDLFSFSPTVGSIAGGGTIRSSSGSSTPVLTTGSDGTSTTFSGVIENGSATSVSLIKTGGGVLTLTGSSSYTGSTSINTGVINIRHANALGVSSTTTVASGATLQLQGGIAVGALPLTLKGVGVSSVGALRNISGNNTWGGTITTETSAVRIYSDAGTLTLSGSTAISSPTNIGVLFWGSGHVTVSGAISIGSAGLTKDGTGTLT
ncbi:MAG: beta strand repeat-containing protein, partial [Bacteroidota bacterium]